MYFNRQGGMCENVLYFDSHALPTINAINYVPRFALPTINAINYVPRFTVHVYGQVMSGIEVNTLKLTWRTETLC